MISWAIVSVTSGLLTMSVTAGVLWGVAYLILIAACCFALEFKFLFPLNPFIRNSQKISEMRSREAFWLPFETIFLSPVGLGALIIAYDWRAENQALHYGSAIGCFLLAVPSFILFRWLSGVTEEKKANQPPQPTPVSRRG